MANSFGKVELKRGIAFICVLSIQALFAIKYIERYQKDYYLVVAAVLCLFSGFILWFRPSISGVTKKNAHLLGVVFLIVPTCFILKYIPIETLNVDRWSVITSFWDAAFDGKYPYAAKSHMNNPPGPMPFYFVLALPFYLGVDYAWMAVAGILIFIFWWKKKCMANGESLVLFLIGFLGLWWEVTSRSNVFFNASLVCILVFAWLKQHKKNSTFYYLAVFTGLMLSTRLVFIIPLMVAFVYLWLNKKEDRRKWIIAALISILTFILTFIPLYAAYPNQFWEINPFIVQGEYLMPTFLVGLCVAACFVGSFFVNSKEQVVFVGGLGLFGTIAVYFFYHFYHVGWKGCVQQSSVDLSYFLFSLPFLTYTALSKPGAETKL